ncbi:MAG: hypothetical protein HZA77_14205 [Candidatus Schekmanbacteria bacterium]|nr:hypothetical protein [Candidatus Schekmanbacteria bacterium]
MNKKFIKALSVILFMSALSAPFTVSAVSYPIRVYHRPDNGKKIMKVGQMAFLFHSGTDDVKKAIHVNDVLTIYRIDTSCEISEVGKARVLSYVGETYLKVEIIQGEIKPNDIGKKDNVSCLVISEGICKQ